MSDIFADNIANITVANGLARVDFVAIEKIDPTQKTATLRPSGRLVIPVAGLLQLAKTIEGLQNEMASRQPDTVQVN
jgi:hypothetical protein